MKCSIFLFVFALGFLITLSDVVNAEWVNETSSYLGSSHVSFRITSVGDWDNAMEAGFFGTMGNRTNLLWYCRRTDSKSIYHLCWSSLDFPSSIISTIVVDLNRDGVMDILVQCEDGILRYIDGKNRNKTPISINKNDTPIFDANIPQVSLVSIFNDCGLPDIAIVDVNGSLVIMRGKTDVSSVFCIGKAVTPTFEQFVLVKGHKGVREVVPLSIVSADINGDCAVDLLYTIYNIDKNTLEVYVFFTLYNRHELLMTLKSANHYGFPTVADLNGDGAPDIIFPLCASEEKSIVSFGNCSGFNGITVFYNNLKGSSVCSNNKCCGGHHYGFDEKESKTFFINQKNICGIQTKPEFPLQMPNSLESPLELRFGDYNRDGYNDLIVPSTYGPLLLTSNSNSDALLPFSCAPLDSQLAHSSPGSHEMYTQGVPFFVVISDRDRLDIILTYHGKNSIPITIYTNHISSLEQNYFLTASALNGVGNIDSWGLYQPGAVHRFRWSDISMNHRWGYGVQLSKSQGHALQSPRLYFGLGRTFSYVEDYTVGILVNRESVHHQWSENLIPNSKLFVWLSPFVSPSEWRLHLYIPSSTYQMLLFVVLVITLGLIGVPILLLKWREVQQDRREWRLR